MLVYIFSLIILLVLGTLFLDQRRKYESFWKYIYALPGPKYYPIVGTTQGLTNGPVEAHKFAMKMIKQYPAICRFWSFNMTFVFLSKPEDIEIILSTTKHISKGIMYNYLHQWLGTGLLTSTGSKWQQRRKILTPAFHFTILQDFVKVFNKETDSLVENLSKICNQPYVDVLEPITEFTLNSIGETSLGVDMNLQPNRKEYKQAIFFFGYHFIYVLNRPWLKFPYILNFTAFSKEIKKTIEILHGFSTSIINDRKKTFHENGNSTNIEKKRVALLDLLLQAKNDRTNAIDDAGIREEVDTFMFEGHDTTTVGFSFVLFSLANEPKWQEEVRREIYEVLGDQEHPTYQQLTDLKLTERCIKESLRLYPSVPAISRVTDEGFNTSSGYYIPKGTGITLHIFSLHRSSDIWENPEKFDPDRFLPENSAKRHPFSYIPFSAGPRNCIGQRFAMLEIKAGLCGVLRNFTLEPVGKPEDIVFKADLVLRTDGEVRVRFVPRKNAS